MDIQLIHHLPQRPTKCGLQIVDDNNYVQDNKTDWMGNGNEGTISNWNTREAWRFTISNNYYKYYSSLQLQATVEVILVDPEIIPPLK